MVTEPEVLELSNEARRVFPPVILPPLGLRLPSKIGQQASNRHGECWACAHLSEEHTGA